MRTRPLRTHSPIHPHTHQPLFVPKHEKEETGHELADKRGIAGDYTPAQTQDLVAHALASHFANHPGTGHP